MGIVIRQSSITTAASYFGVLIGYANVLWLFPAVLSAEEIGLLRLLPSMAFLLLPLTQLGLSQSVLKFYPQFEDKKGKNELLSFTLIANLIGFAITILLFKIFSAEITQLFEERSPLANDFIHVAILLIFILSVQVVFESFSKSILKIIYPGIIKEIVIRVLYSAIVISFFMDWIDLNQLINSLIIVYSIGLFLLIGYVYKNAPFRIGLRFETLDLNRLKEILRYSLFAVLGASGTYIMLNIDQVMISNLVGLEGNGIYTTAFYIAVVIELPRRAIANITTPLVSQHFQRGELSEINKLYKQVSINQMMIGSLVLIGILVNLKSLFSMIPNSATYQAGLIVVYIIGLGKIIDMTFGINGEIILMSKHYRYNVIFTLLLAIMAIVTNWIFIKIYGIDGAALATAITLVSFNLVKLIFLKSKLDLWPFTINNLWLAIISVGTFYTINLLPQWSNPVIDILYRSTLTTIIYMAFCLWLKISPEVNGMAYKYTKFRFLQ